MADLSASPALLRSLSRFAHRPLNGYEQRIADGLATKPVTQAHQRQALSVSTERAMKAAARARLTPEQRSKAIERRRKWAGGGSMPPDVRAGYSEAERAALAVIADACRRKGFCDLCLDEIGRIAGVSRTSVQNAIRKARSRERSQISVRERPQQGGKSLTNVIKIVCASWIGWIKRAIGFKRLNTSETGDNNSLSEYNRNGKRALERVKAEPAWSPLHALRVAGDPKRNDEARSLFDLASLPALNGWRR
ncbi:hypothetical protein [Rhizobium sp. FY34]|uniref:hypothetical protein n=1 Tax=Rhizobium sp. FY34 TaxID=2562309 RepID=UPI0010BFBD65|nr:hypothetical protein [Rhizobium sp. FY34]